MKRILIVGLLSLMVGGIHADAYLDSLRSFVYCQLSSELLTTEAEAISGLSFAEQLSPDDSLLLVLKEYVLSDFYREAYYRALVPYARENVPHQSLYLLLQACHAPTKEAKAMVEKDPAYLTANEQYQRAVNTCQQGPQTINGIIVLGSYASFLKHYYPNQASRLNDFIGSLQKVDNHPKDE